jgi:hypothetical protein
MREPYRYEGESGPLFPPSWSWRDKLALAGAIVVVWGALVAVFGGGGNSSERDDLCSTPSYDGPYVVRCDP